MVETSDTLALALGTDGHARAGKGRDDLRQPLRLHLVSLRRNDTRERAARSRYRRRYNAALAITLAG